MMKSILHTLREIDCFGAIYQPVVSSNVRRYKSKSGGLLTLTLYGLSLAFFIYNMIQWIGGENLPKIILTYQYDYKLGHDFQEVTLIIMGDSYSNHADPFDPQALIFQPYFQNFKNGTVEDLNYELRLEPTNFYSLVIQNFSLQNYPISVDPNQISDGQMILIADCVNETLPHNYKCATKEAIEEFYSYNNQFFQMQIMIQQFNSKEGLLKTIKNEVFAYIDTASTYYSQIILKLQTTIFDVGWVFQDNHKLTYLNDYTFITQNININSLFSLMNRNVYVYFYVSLSPNVSEQLVQYPKFNEVLANTGSIISAIFYISFFAQLFNKYFFDLEILNQIIALYYPEFSQIKINYSIFGRINKVYLKDQKLDNTRFSNYYGRLQSVAREKVTLVNIIYEISRLQFIIQDSLLNQNVYKCRQYGIPFNPNVKLKETVIEKFDQSPKSPNSHSEEQSVCYEDDQILSDQDFDIFCLKNKWLWYW